MWVSKKKWMKMEKEIDDLKKDYPSLDQNTKESIESNKQLIEIVKQLHRCLETSAGTGNEIELAEYKPKPPELVK